MKKLILVITATILTFTMGVSSFAMVNGRSYNYEGSYNKASWTTGSMNTTNSRMSTSNLNQMIELEKVRLKQAIDNELITAEQAEKWQSEISAMEKNGQILVNQNGNVVTSVRYEQMIELEKNRLQRAIDNKMISTDQVDFWNSQIDLMKKNFDAGNYDLYNLCLTSYTHNNMWYNINNNNLMNQNNKWNNMNNRRNNSCCSNNGWNN